MASNQLDFVQGENEVYDPKKKNIESYIVVKSFLKNLHSHRYLLSYSHSFNSVVNVHVYVHDH